MSNLTVNRIAIAAILLPLAVVTAMYFRPVMVAVVEFILVLHGGAA